MHPARSAPSAPPFCSYGYSSSAAFATARVHPRFHHYRDLPFSPLGAARLQIHAQVAVNPPGADGQPGGHHREIIFARWPLCVQIPGNHIRPALAQSPYFASCAASLCALSVITATGEPSDHACRMAPQTTAFFRLGDRQHHIVPPKLIACRSATPRS